MLCFDLVTCYFNQNNENTNIGYNMNYIKVLELSRKDLSPYVN